MAWKSGSIRTGGDVIPGRSEAASPESITTIGSMDSGPAPSKSAVADLDNRILLNSGKPEFSRRIPE
jgi:hypothetical protein